MKSSLRHPKKIPIQGLFILFSLCTGTINSQNSDTTFLLRGIEPEKAPQFFLDFYQRHLSHLRGTNCPMYPSCSQYAGMVIERYSPLKAYLLTTDRLLRCGHDYSTYSNIVVNQRKRWIDLPYCPAVSFPDEESVGMHSSAFATDNKKADFFYKNGFFEQAYHEYVHCLYMQRDALIIRKAACAAYHAYDYQRFIREILSLVNLLPSPEDRGYLFLLAAKRSYSEGMFEQTFKILEKYRELFTAPEQFEEYRILSTITSLYCSIDTVPNVTENDFIKDSPLRIYAGRIDSLRLALNSFQPRRRGAAGFLSVVVPGSGYMLGGRNRTALFSFLFNGLLGWSAVEFVGHKNYGAAAFSALVGSGFYLGSIVGSVRSVDTYNQRKRHAVITRYCKDLVVDP